MDERSLHPEVRETLVQSVVPFGFANVVALTASPIVISAVATDRVAAEDLRLWTVSVWIGAALQLVLLLVRKPAISRSIDMWERAYGVLELYIGASFGVAFAIDVVSGEPLTWHLLVLCFCMIATAAAVVSFAGAPSIGRRYLFGLWATTGVIAAYNGVYEILAIGGLISPMAWLYLTFAHRLLRSALVERQRTRDLSRDLAVQASTDELTGLLNRRATLQRIQQCIAAGNDMTALFIDLDGFKRINDTYGHAAGDTVLLNVAERLQDVTREGDIIGRLGGDEFIVALTTAADQHLADAIAARFAGEISRSHGSIHELAVTASVGAARSIDGLTAEDLLGCADTAMYRAKARGGNTAVHYLESHLD